MLRRVYYLIIVILLPVVFVSCGKPAQVEEKGQETSISDSSSEPKKYKERVVTLRSEVATEIRHYDFEEAVVQYRVSGVFEGIQTYYISDWGRKKARFSDIKIIEGKSEYETKKLSLSVDDKLYEIDIPQNKGYVSDNPNASDYLKKMNPEYRKGFVFMGAEMMRRLGGEFQGEKKYLDKTCSEWYLPREDARHCLWQGLPLFSDIETGRGRVQLEILKLDLQAKVPSDIYKLPKDVEILENPNAVKYSS